MLNLKHLKTKRELKKELEAIEENNVDMTYIKKRIVEDFTWEKLETYCKNHEDTPERVIARASEILLNRYHYELNLIITQLCFSLSGENDSEETEKQVIYDFTTEWLEHGLAND